MRTPLITLLTVVGLASTASAQDDDWYFQLGLGGVFPTAAEDVPGGDIDFDQGFGISAAIGKRLGGGEDLGLAVEFESIFTDFKVDERDITAIPSAINDEAGSLAWMLNGRLDWKFSDSLSLYLVGGLGYATTLEYESWDSGNLNLVDEDGFAYQARVGFTFDLGGNYDVSIGYRFFQHEAIEIENTITSETFDLDPIQNHAEITLRWGI